MSAVLGHFFDRTFPVVKHSEYRPARRRNGPMRFAKLPRLPACRLHDVDHDFTETSRYLPGIEKIENEIAVMLVNQAFQLPLHRLTLPQGGDVVAQLDDDYLPNLFVLERDRRGVDFRHADFREKVYYPTENDQFPDVENDENPGADQYPHDKEGVEWMASGQR